MDKKTLTPKKKRIVLAICIAVLLVILYLSAYIVPSEAPAAEDALAERLEQALSGMKGVGEVRVVINYRTAEAAIPTSAEQEESVLWEKEPEVSAQPVQEVCGVLVVAEGAEDIRVRTEMLSAVSALMDISMDQIEILY